MTKVTISPASRPSTTSSKKTTTVSKPTTKPTANLKTVSKSASKTVSTRPSASAAKKPAAPAAPATQGNWISQRIQNSVAGVGTKAGGYVYGVGNSVTGVGRGLGDTIANATRGWGQGVAGYGNDIKDAVKAGGPRVSTAGNPLGLAGSGSKGLSMPGKARSAGGSASNPLGL